MAYWGTIQSQTAVRASTADLWAAIRADAAAHPGGLPLPTLQGVNEIRAAAAQVRNASAAFGKARDTTETYGLTQAITGDMVSTVPWSRDAATIAVLADYQVRFNARMTSPLGRQFTQQLTMLFPNGTLPATVGELVTKLGAFAPASGSLGEGSFDGVGDVSITVV